MAYNFWTTIDNGREGLWENKTLFETLKIIGLHEGEDVYDLDSAIYAELEDKLPNKGWIKIEQNGEKRPLFRDYSKPWTGTGLVDLSYQKFRLTDLGRQLINGSLGPREFYLQFVKNWTEDGEYPFHHLSSAFLKSGRPLSFKEIYYGIVLNYRIGDDINASLSIVNQTSEDFEKTRERRLTRMLGIMESAGLIAKEDSSKSGAKASWIAWDLAGLRQISETQKTNTSTSKSGEQDLVGQDFIDELKNDTNSAGFKFSKSLLSRFIAGLLAKKFVILTGLSGSGKTKLGESLAKWITSNQQQVKLVAVGADWNNNEQLLGYPDGIREGVYITPANCIVEFMLAATEDDKNPYFLILDEMNLSHVERYFSDFLSALESSDGIISLHNKISVFASSGKSIPNSIKIPSNLFIIGTVNVDETTYMFSPKVLDRANVIEFRIDEEDMSSYLQALPNPDINRLNSLGSKYQEDLVKIANNNSVDLSFIDQDGTSVSKKIHDDLITLFNMLLDIGSEFGFRSVKEITRFIAIHRKINGESWSYKDSLDAQIVQKLMPKLHGSSRKLNGVMSKIESFAQDRQLPLTMDKTSRMKNRLQRDGFTSFAEN